MSTHILENYFNFLNGSASLYSIWILPALNRSTSVPATPVREMQYRNVFQVHDLVVIGQHAEDDSGKKREMIWLISHWKFCTLHVESF